MNPQINEARPPYVQFFARAVENRNASIEAGHTVYYDVNFVAITPQGSKDRIERVATEWLDHITREAKQQRFDPSWAEHYKRCYKDFLEGQETPLNGSPISEWPVATPAQVKTLLQYGLRTVEDVASANEEAIARLGMGGRALKNKAEAWLATSSNIGKVTERITALEVENASLKAKNVELENMCSTLTAQLKIVENGANAAKNSKPAKPSQETGDMEFN